MLRVLDLFSGIGGFSLGLERTGGFETVAFCEIEPFPRKVLAKHWPEVPIYDDVRTLTAERLAADGIAVDVICGGFPCQDISTAGKGAGLAGERSGLWSEIARLAGELRPQFIIVENVAALLGRGLGDVLGDLAALGYDAEWHCIPATYVGAPHRRDRIWIVAYAASFGRFQGDENSGRRIGERRETVAGFADRGEIMADSNRQGLEGRAQAGHIGSLGTWCQQFIERCPDRIGGTWRTEPDVGRVANGVPCELDGGLNAQEFNQDKSAASIPSLDQLRELRSDGETGEAPSFIRRTRTDRGALPAMPCQSGPEGWAPQSEGAESLQTMRDFVSSNTQHKTHSLQPLLSFNDGQDQCRKTVGQIWLIEPSIARVASGVKDRAHRLKGLGNAVVPEIPELIGNAILAAIQSRSALSAAGTGVSSSSPVNLPAASADQGGGRLCVPFHATEIAGE